MSDAFRPILDASHRVTEVARKIPHAHGVKRGSAEQDAREALQKLVGQIDRRLTLGLPPIRNHYREGRAAWEYDIGQALTALREAAGALLQVALQAPVPSRGRLSDLAPPQRRETVDAQNRAVTAIIDAAGRVTKARDEVWRLAQWVDTSRKAAPPAPSSPPQPLPQEESLSMDMIRVHHGAVFVEAGTMVGTREGKVVSLDPVWGSLGNELRKWKTLLRPILHGVAAAEKPTDPITADYARKAIHNGESKLCQELLRRHGIRDEPFKNEILVACNLPAEYQLLIVRLVTLCQRIQAWVSVAGTDIPPQLLHDVKAIAADLDAAVNDAGGDEVPAHPKRDLLPQPSGGRGPTGSTDAAPDGPIPTAPTGPDRYVTLDQVAALINRRKKTLERYLHDPKYKQYGMPQPDVQGGGGKPHEWRWSNLRPWLEKTFDRQLPEEFPRR